MIKLIVASDPNGVIGVNGQIPWKHPADLKRFRQLTMGCSVVMGRLTHRSLPKGLPGRTIVVVSKTKSALGGVYRENDVAYCPTLDQALELGEKLNRGKPVWICGGSQLYQTALSQGAVDEVDLTLVPEVTRIREGDKVARIDLTSFGDRFVLTSETGNADDPRIVHRTYRWRH